MSLPIIVLVGRPNVGKSTLFNRLTRSRDALVADFPGLTRDRQYGIGRVGSRPYVVVDTGGLRAGAQQVDALVEAQVQQALEEADQILMMVDARAGVTPDDQEIAVRLRRLGKPLWLAVNKSEAMDPAEVNAEFAALGLAGTRLISASHGRGVSGMLDALLADLPPGGDTEFDEDEQDRIRLAVIGRPNVGKSTLINRLLGEQRMLACDLPGTTRDSVSIPFDSAEGQRFTLVDTAGVRRRARVSDPVEKFSVIKTLQAMDQAHVVIMMLDARQGVSEQDASLLGLSIERGRALAIAVNKWDGLAPDQRNEFRRQLQRKLGFADFARVLYISALHGSNIREVLHAAAAAHRSATRSLPTAELSRVLQEAVQAHAPPRVGGRPIRLRYAHQGGRNPPIVVVHGNRTERLPKAYRRYLVNRFREAFELRGTPLRVELRSGANPYADRTR